MIENYEGFLLVSDMDGTLIGTDGSISAENKAAIAAFVHKGGRFAIATGRTPANAAAFFEGIVVNTPCIFYNGAMLYDWQAKKVLQTSALEGEIWREFAAELLRRFPEACIEAYTEGNCYVMSALANDDPRLEAEYHKYTHASLDAVRNKTWLKLFVFASRDIEKQMLELAAHMGIDKIATSFFSATNYLEFVNLGTTKGSMLEILRRLPENQGRTVVASGDFENDIEMLRNADCGVAPANASPDTRAAADCIGVSCDEHLMRHIICEIMPRLI